MTSLTVGYRILALGWIGLQMNIYSNKTDLEINILVAKSLGLTVLDSFDSGSVFVRSQKRASINNWCQSNGNCMPLAWGNKIGVYWEDDDGKWMSFHVKSGKLSVVVYSETPLRAICECYLLMKDFEK